MSTKTVPVRDRAPLSWTPVRKGRIYCSPACGRGCTWAEYQKAEKAAAKLAVSLGRSWSGVVWENLGWHHKASIGGNAHVHQHSTEYWCDLKFGDVQCEATGSTPKKALDAALKKAKAIKADFEDLLTYL